MLLIAVGITSGRAEGSPRYAPSVPVRVAGMVATAAVERKPGERTSAGRLTRSALTHDPRRAHTPIGLSPSGSTSSQRSSFRPRNEVGQMSTESASGEHCVQCWGIISAVENAHRNESGTWEHDECPED